MIVVDASVALSWSFKDEQTPETVAVLQQVTVAGAVVPAIWHLEVANVLQLAVRRKRISSELRDKSLVDLLDLRIEVDSQSVSNAWSATLVLADRHQLTVYDASYLELALRRAFPLATLDRELAAAARAERVSVLP